MRPDILPHLWTLSPRLAHAFRPRLAPESRSWETMVDDPAVGPVRLTGRMREHPGDELLLLVHGLGGSVSSHYMVRGADAADAAGLSCLRMSLRGADRLGEDYYHAGQTEDLHAALASPDLARFRTIYVVGYSLGGNVTLRLGAEPLDPRVKAVAAVCSPIDLALSEAEIDSPGVGLYRWYLLRSLADLYRAVAARAAAVGRPVPFPVERLAELRRIRDWDERVVAPRYGFRDAPDYYARASAGPVLPNLRIPALLLNSEGDPMVPSRSVRPALAGASPLLRVAWVRGGHVGFPAGVSCGLAEGVGVDAQVITWLRAAGSAIA